MTKQWRNLDVDVIATLPAQLGVYEIGDADDQVVRIGYAGGTEPFGMRTALERERGQSLGTRFRLEFTHGYLTRWQELLMCHVADHGHLPPGNADMTETLGQLRPACGQD